MYLWMLGLGIGDKLEEGEVHALQKELESKKKKVKEKIQFQVRNLKETSTQTSCFFSKKIKDALHFLKINK